MSVSGILSAKSLNLPTGNVQTLLDNETQRAIAKELEITTSLSSETTTARAAEQANATNINTASMNLQASITAEETRATQKETEIEDSVTNNFNTLNDKITVEESRATTKENENDAKITNEENLRVNAVSGLQGNIDSIIATLNTIEQKIAIILNEDGSVDITGIIDTFKEVRDVINSDPQGTLFALVKTNETNIATNNSSLDSKIEAETTRASGREAILQNDIDTNTTSISNLTLFDGAYDSLTGKPNLNIKAPIDNPTFTGTVGGVTKAMVGLDLVENTADLSKPVSTLQQQALNLKADQENTSLSGIPEAPTATTSTNTNQIATTKFVQDRIDELIGGAPAALDTLNELAAAINDDDSYASTVTSSISLKAPIDNPTFTGTVGGITKAMVGLDLVENTADSSKPVSTLQQQALNLKADATAITGFRNVTVSTSEPSGSGHVTGDIWFVVSA
ncbi:MAG: hypothetical protein CL728_04735 [Chloroflexi bacterium]|nr:hypothetical protein [Chloroflexota bacterium]